MTTKRTRRGDSNEPGRTAPGDSGRRDGATLTLPVPDEGAGERLDRFLASRAGELSRARIKGLIDRGLCRVDDKAAKAAQRLKAGQRVDLTVPETADPDLTPDATVVFTILYEDADIVVVDKPAGLVVHPAAGHGAGTLVHGLLAACPDLSGVGGEARPGIVHRLDKDTSGVLIAAKTDRAHRVLADGFKNRAFDKTYLAVCVGRPEKNQGEIDAPIGRHPIRRKEMSIRSESGRRALTRYEVIETFPAGASYLRVHLLTGRTHQIRVHLASIGCPILGDPVYGKGAAGLKGHLGPMKHLVRRQQLHAHRLGLPHPVTNERMEFVAPVPADMVGVLAALAGPDG